MNETYSGVKFKHEKLGELKFDRSLIGLVSIVQDALSELPEESLRGVTGNISSKLEDGILITSTGAPLADLIVPDNFCKVDKNSSEKVYYYGVNIPSSETPMHLNIHKNREDVNFILHMHPSNLEKIQILDRYPITQQAYPYGTFELANEATKALGSNDIVILRDHGTVVVGKKLEELISKTMKLCNI